MSVVFLPLAQPVSSVIEWPGVLNILLQPGIAFGTGKCGRFLPGTAGSLTTTDDHGVLNILQPGIAFGTGVSAHLRNRGLQW